MKFEDIFIDDTKNVTRIDSNKFGESGNIAIVDQGKKLIAGYTNNDNYKVCTEERIIFGDHTRNFKYINIPFICGADGTKVLKIINPSKTSYKYMYYYLLASYIPNTGYNRHFKWVKQLKFNIHDYQTQIDIVKKLDSITNLISLKENQIIQLDNLVKSQFVEMFGDILSNEVSYKKQCLDNVANIGSSKRIYASEYVDKGIPFYRSKEIIELGHSKKPSVELYITEKKYNEVKQKFGVPKKGDILVTAVGTIGETWVVNTDNPFYYKDGNLLLVSLKEKMSEIFFKYSLDILIDDFKRKNVSGSSYGALTIEKFKTMEIIYPPIELQNKFAKFVKQVDKQKFVLTKMTSFIPKILYL